MKKFLLFISFVCLCGIQAQTQQLAFPGAEGFGRYALGVRGVSNPEIYRVTNLNDAGAGSLRDAVSKSGRIVVFDVSGVIKINSRIVFSGNSYIAGQTAPGDGIIVYGNGVSFSGANNLIVRYMRFFMGRGGDDGKDAGTIASGTDMIFDHCTFLWGRDENFSINWDSKGTEPTNITIQHSIIGQGLVSHSCGGLIQTSGGTSIIGCLYIHNETRNPKVKGLNQFINNVVYNWGGSNGYILADSDGPSWAWMEGNYFVSGPNSSTWPFTRARANFQLYAQNNYVDSNKDGVLNGADAPVSAYGNSNAGAPPTMVSSVAGFASGNCSTCANIPKPFLSMIEPVLSPNEAIARVIASAGASLPARSEIEAFLMDDLQTYGKGIKVISNENSNGITNNVGIVYTGEKSDDDMGGTTKAANGYLEIENYINNISQPAGKPYVRGVHLLKMESRSIHSISLIWKNNQPDADHIALEISTDGKNFNTLAELSGAATSYQASELVEETFYYFRITTRKGSLSATSAVLRTSTEGDPGKPLACTEPEPANGGTSRYYTSVDFSWTNETGSWSQPVAYEIYFGETPDELTKISGDQPISVVNFEYTPATPLTRQKTYYWRVDAVNHLGTTTGEIWSFTTSTYSFTATLVDIGQDYIPEKTTYENPQSGVRITGTNAHVVYAGTENEMTFTPSSGITRNDDNGCYRTSPTTVYWRMPNAGQYITVTPTSELSAQKVIAKVFINGTDASPDGSSRTSPIFLFSDKAPFDEKSILGYEQTMLNICRAAGNADPASVVIAPEGTKSFRIYNNVKLNEIGGEDVLYVISSDGDITLSAGGQPRIAYIAVRLESIRNDDPNALNINTINALKINGIPAQIHQETGEIIANMTATGEFNVTFILDDDRAQADFTSGEKYNFTNGPLTITVTAANGDVKTYTVSVQVTENKPEAKKIALLVPSVATGGVGNQGYDQISANRFMSAFTDYEVELIGADGPALSKAALIQQYDSYSLIVIHPTVAGDNTYLMSLVNMVGEKPILNLKSFCYTVGSSPRWGWATPNNASGTNINYVTVAADLQNHPIFKDMQFEGANGESLYLYTGTSLPVANAISKVSPLPFTGSAWNKDWDKVNHLLAAHTDTRTETTQMHEIMLGEAAKYLLIAISTESGAFALLNDNAIQLLKNAADYLTDPTLYYDYVNHLPVGGIQDQPNVICDIHFNDAAKLANGVYTESFDMPVVTITGNVGLEPATNPLVEDCGTPGQIRLNGNDGRVEIKFDEPLKLLRIWARTTSGNTDAILEIECLRVSNNSRMWLETVDLLQNSNAVCGFFEKENIDEPCIIRMRRTTSGSLGILRIYAEGEPRLSNEANLRGLTTSVGTFTPAFNSNITEYTMAIESSVASITFTATPSSRNATITGDGKQPLVIGENVFPIVVTAQDGKTKMTYTVKVMVIEPTPISNIEISGLDEMEVLSSITLTPIITPEFVTDRTIVWTSLTPSIASIYVDANGRALITGISEGTAVIRVTSVANPDIFVEKTFTVLPSSLQQRQMERLDRGLVAASGTGTAGANNVFLSWRLYSTDPLGVQFNLYRNNETTPINSQPLDAAHTNYTLTNGSMTDLYSVATLVNGVEVEHSAKVKVWTSRDANNNPYLSIPVEKPATGRVWNGTNFVDYSNYDIGDAIVADLDGDGEYEIVFMWTPQNLQDNSNEGYTGNVFLDAYKLDGTKLWGAGKFIDLGNNIRAGAHYTQFLAFDFDGDGKAEIIIKTADGSKDTEGNFVGNPAFDDGRYIQNTSSRYGRILEGAEYISVFEGATGKLLDTKPFQVARGSVGDWGDTYGNRVDRFLSTVAYLDGVRPSAVMCRGYYARTTLTAYDWDGKDIKTRWIFDTKGMANASLYQEQGNHNLSVADVDGSGKDCIIYGAMTIKYDGTPLYSTGYKHGDAMHVGKLDPSRPGIQVMKVCESPSPWGMEMHDAATGELIFGVIPNPTNSDVGRGMCADIDPLSPGNESWASSAIDGTYSVQGVKIGNRISGVNMAIWWDGDTGRELMDGGNGGNPSITKINPTGTLGSRSYSSSTLVTFNGARSNGGTKQNPSLQVDILGDWREEALYRSSDNTELRIYTTTSPTVHTGAGAVPSEGIPTLMQDNVYRLAITWQNSAYNQPPHTGFFLGYNMENVPRKGGVVFTITFDPNGGNFEDNTAEVKQISTITGAYFVLPKVTHPRNKVFDGWYINENEKFDPTVIYKEDIKLTAMWTSDGEEIYVITFDAQASDVTNPESIQVIYGEEIGTLPVLHKTGYTFNGWNLNQDGTGEFFTETTVYDLTDNITLYAIWLQNVVSSVSESVWDNLKIYPNPVSDILTISGLKGGEQISVYDIGGRLCVRIKASHDREDIVVNYLPQGAYLVKITKDYAEKVVKVIVK